MYYYMSVSKSQLKHQLGVHWFFVFKSSPLRRKLLVGNNKMQRGEMVITLSMFLLRCLGGMKTSTQWQPPLCPEKLAVSQKQNI